MTIWTSRYRLVTVPNFDMDGSFTYYMILAVRQFSQFSVPAFLFISGYYIAYADKGNQSTSIGKTIKSRLVSLVIPYIIWSIAAFIFDGILGTTYPLIKYIELLFTEGANGPLYFTPLLCYCYILSPLLLKLARKSLLWLLIVTFTIQLSTIIARYTSFMVDKNLLLDQFIKLTPDWSLPRWIFYFSAGIAVSLHANQVRIFIEKWKWQLLFATITFGFLSIVEAELIYRAKLLGYWRPTAGLGTFTFNFYAISFIFSFLSFNKLALPFSTLLAKLNNRSYGIYLIHFLGMTICAKVVYHIGPWILGQEWLLQPILIAAGLGIPYSGMIILEWIQKRKMTSKILIYRHVFG